MTPEALDLIFGGVAAGGLGVLAGIRARARRAASRERSAHRNAKWEVRTRYQRGNAVVELVRVARWDGNEVVIDTDEHSVVIPDSDIAGITDAEINAGVRAYQRNTE
jgi:hypothetical protein